MVFFIFFVSRSRVLHNIHWKRSFKTWTALSSSPSWMQNAFFSQQQHFTGLVHLKMSQQFRYFFKTQPSETVGFYIFLLATPHFTCRKHCVTGICSTFHKVQSVVMDCWYICRVMGNNKQGVQTRDNDPLKSDMLVLQFSSDQPFYWTER